MGNMMAGPNKWQVEVPIVGIDELRGDAEQLAQLAKTSPSLAEWLQQRIDEHQPLVRVQSSWADGRLVMAVDLHPDVLGRALVARAGIEPAH